MINKQLHPDAEYFLICSQLVYQIYEDCGKDYHLHIHEGLLQAAAMPNDSIYIRDYLDTIDDSNDLLLETAADEPILQSSEALAEQLYQALQESKEESAETILLESWHPTFQKAKQFLQKTEALLKHANIDMPIDALFVTPVDLLKNCPDLKSFAEAQVIYKS